MIAATMASEEGMPVDLYIYDLTHGLASLLSPAILGRQIEGVWHTSVVVYNREFFYGGHGISSCAPGSTQLGPPHQTERLGQTFVPFQVFADYLQGLATTTYTGTEYRLLEHNCNHFSEEVAQFLCGGHVPKHILRQPDTVLTAPQRQALGAVLDNLLPGQPRQVYANGVRHSRQDSPDYLTLNSEIEEARVQSAELEQRRSTLAEKLARKERKKEKKRKKQLRGGNGDESEMAEAVETSLGAELAARAGPSAAALDDERQDELRRRTRDPPIVYKDIDGAAEFEKLTQTLAGVELAAEEKQSLDELQQYLVQGEGSWVLGDEFLGFVARLLNDPALSSEVRVATLRCLAAAALRDDVSLLLHQDRRHHALLNFAHDIDRRPQPEQHAITLFMCNLCEHVSSSEWLLYISEWERDGQPLSNIRVTTKVCVHAALSDAAELREAGTALMHNVATKEVKTVRWSVGRALRARLPRLAKSKVFDEVCAELALALLQLLQSAPGEEHLWRSVRALARLAAHSHDVPQIIAMVGPAPADFRGVSPRVDEQIDSIMKAMK